jgi:type IV fimbrial biogenesis protein FimT
VLAGLHPQRGFSLIELMVGIAVFATLMVLGLPSLTTWMQNSQIRTAADAIQNGLQVARGEAVRRNTTVRFHLTDTADNACATSATGTNWVVSLDVPDGACATAAWNEDTTAPPAVRILQMRPSTEGTRNAVVAANQASVIFNGLGRVTPVPAQKITINVSNPTGGTCATIGTPAPMRCLRVEVSTGGQIRLCDPAFASTDPQGC